MMNVYSRFLAILIALPLYLCMHNVLADSFIVSNIEFQGLQHLQQSTILSYLPVQTGESIDDQDTADILRTLYQTGFFDDVHLQRSGNTLVIIVKERPVIDAVTLEGNKEIDKKKLKPVLSKIGVAQGEIYDPSKLNMIRQGLIEQYKELGFYSVQIDTQVNPLPRNRVQILIKINEGSVAKVHSIKFVGNKAFSQRQLHKQMKLKEANWITWIGHKDRYSRVKLDEDLRNLAYFYYNHGYLRFKILSKQIVMSKDNKSVDITIYVVEGAVYHVSGYQVEGVKDPAVDALVTLKKGQVFSREQVLAIDKKITAYYANHGRALATVHVHPEEDDATAQVFLTFLVMPGPIVYIRHINVAGNDYTSEKVLRASMLQMEAAPYSQNYINESKRRLSNLPYLKDINVSTSRVADIPDQVDLNYHVTEVNAGKIMAQAGYSDTDGFLYGAGATEPNFLGTGKEVGLNFQNSQYEQSYNFSYTNPYVTSTGISRSMNLFYTVTTPNSDTNRASYRATRTGGTLTYGLPITRHDRINIGGGYSYIKLGDINDDTAPSIVDFLNDHPSPYNQFEIYTSWLHSGLDRAIFPNSGYYQSLGLDLGVPVVGSSLSYYKATLTSRYYYSLGYGFVLDPHVLLGYGNGYGNTNGEYPFFENFYAGGINTVPGFEPNTLGPRNPNDSDDALGGNLLTVAGMNFVFPNFISERLRTSLTLTAGNVFDTNKLAADETHYEDFDLDNLRTSIGLLVEFYSPFGPLEFTVATPLHKKDGDEMRIFDFALGTSI